MCFSWLAWYSHLTCLPHSGYSTHPLTSSKRPGRSELAIHYLICSIVNNIQNTNWAFYYPHDLKSWITVQKMEEVKKFSRWKKFQKIVLFQMSKKAQKTTYFFCFYSYLGGGWFKPKYGYFFNPSLIDTGSYVRSYETSCLILMIID